MHRRNALGLARAPAVAAGCDGGPAARDDVYLATDRAEAGADVAERTSALRQAVEQQDATCQRRVRRYASADHRRAHKPTRTPLS